MNSLSNIFYIVLAFFVLSLIIRIYIYNNSILHNLTNYIREKKIKLNYIDLIYFENKLKSEFLTKNELFHYLKKGNYTFDKKDVESFITKYLSEDIYKKSLLPYTISKKERNENIISYFFYFYLVIDLILYLFDWKYYLLYNIISIPFLVYIFFYNRSHGLPKDILKKYPDEEELSIEEKIENIKSYMLTPKVYLGVAVLVLMIFLIIAKAVNKY